MSYKEKKTLVEAAREYAKHDEYHVTRNYLNALCDEIDRLKELNRNVFAKMADNGEMFKDAERYYWLKTRAWDIPEEVIAPCVLMCDGRMQNWEWVTGVSLDEEIDKLMEIYK